MFGLPGLMVALSSLFGWMICRSIVNPLQRAVHSAGRIAEGDLREVVGVGEVMDDMVNQVRRVTDLVGEITSASVEQSQGIDQINDAVTQMDQATPQNAALVEEGAANASPGQQAQKLAEVVSVFKTDESAACKPAAVSPQHMPPAPAAERAAPASKGTDDWASF